jgi:hypothetical protein
VHNFKRKTAPHAAFADYPHQCSKGNRLHFASSFQRCIHGDEDLPFYALKCIGCRFVGITPNSAEMGKRGEDEAAHLFSTDGEKKPNEKKPDNNTSNIAEVVERGILSISISEEFIRRR